MKCRVDITVSIVWNDNENLYDTRPPAVGIILLRDDLPYLSAPIYAEDGWQHTFLCLPVYKSPTQKYTYRVGEISPPTGYTSIISGFRIINTLGDVTIRGTKQWVDNHNEFLERPAQVTVHLLQNGQMLRSAEVASPPDTEDSAVFSFPDVPALDENGVAYAYTFSEEAVANYVTEIVGFTITNTSVHLIVTP